MAEPASTPSPAATAPAPAPAVVPAPAQNVEPLPSATATAEKSGPAILAIVSPFTTTSFVSGIEGWNPITASGTPGPAGSADQVIAAAQASGITLERR